MRKPAQPWLDEWESGDIEERVLDATKVDDAACAENPSVQVRGLARSPRFRAPWLCTARERQQRRGRRGMIGDCADATGLLDGGEQFAVLGFPARRRSGEGHRDLGPAPSGRGTRAPTGQEEGALQPCGPGPAGGTAAPAEATRSWPDAAARTPGHGAALAPRLYQEAERCPVQAQAAGPAPHRALGPP
jgi:hypothetical protein